jgi:amidase
MGGHAFLADFRPEFNATVVERLEQAGAVLLGKLNLTEGAMGGYHRQSRIPVNPWREDLWAGASSSGSGVATAAGLCFASLGTDTGGSIRFPSMANGIVGLKPTYGRVSRYGVLPLSETLDHVGPMTRRVADAAAVLNVIAGHDANDPTSLQVPVPDMLAQIDRGIDGIRFGYDGSYAADGAEPGLVAAIETALGKLESLGGQVVDVRMPSFSPELLGGTWFTICAYEAATAHASKLAAHAEEYGDYFREFLAFGESVTDEQYAAAAAVRSDFSAQFREVLGQVDALVCPSGGAPFPLPREVQYGGMGGFDEYMPKVQMHFTAPANFAGTPTLSQRCGFSDEGLPYTIQFMGSALSEPSLCRIGYAYEVATDWHDQRPGI